MMEAQFITIRAKQHPGRALKGPEAQPTQTTKTCKTGIQTYIMNRILIEQ